MKCSCCGEEVGNSTVCPVCGSKVNAGSATAERKAYTPAYTRSGFNPYEGNPYLNGGAKQQGKSAQPLTSDGILKQLEKEKTELIEKCAKAVTKIVVDCGGGRCFSGTGWCGYKNYIITNAHVVEPMKEGIGRSITCEFSDKLDLGSEQKIPVTLEYYSRVEDIAILLPQTGRLPAAVQVLRIEDKPTKQGELVFTIGNPLHYKFTYMEGAVSNPNYVHKGSGRKFTVLQTTLTLNHGNSGGPVMNSNGDIVGMATFGEREEEIKRTLNPLGVLAGKEIYDEQKTYKDIQGYGFCVKSEAILAAIDEIE